MAKKTQATKKSETADSDVGSGLLGLCKELGGIAEELRPLYHLEASADNLGDLASALNGVSQALAASVIAAHGKQEDRLKAVEHLKSWFWESDIFKER